MKLLACAQDALPCPPDDQRLVSFSDLFVEAVQHIDPLLLAKAYGFGAGSVLTWWSIGFAVAAATKALSKA